MLEIYRRLSFIPEIGRAVKYLRLGLAEVQKITAANDFYDPIFLYLAGGLERLFKTMLCLSFIEVHRRLPNRGDIWNNKNGHDLLFLKSEVEKICVPVTRLFASMDYGVIANDTFTDQICGILSEFGQRARYFSLDAILGVEQEYDPKDAWEEMESSVGIELYGEEEFYKLAVDPKRIDETYYNSNKEIVKRLEIFFRALTRQFVFGNFSGQSKTFLFQIEDFTDIKDSQLGLTEYGRFKNEERIRRV